MKFLEVGISTWLAVAFAASLTACGGSDDPPATAAPPPPAPVETAKDYSIPTAGSLLPPLPANATISSARCITSTFSTTIAASLIGEPTTGANVSTATWVAAAGVNPAHCKVEGYIMPVDPAAKNIQYAVGMPASWNYRSVQNGGGGNNGSVPAVTSGSSRLVQPPMIYGFATFGSDSGHQNSDGNSWGLVDEAVKNLGYMQMKKTYDVSMILLQQMYGQKPRFKYYIGGSQGGREALTVAQRYGADYDGIVADEPIVGFATLTLSPPLNRMAQNAAVNHIPTAKGNAIQAEIMRQCDKLDGLTDGIISNYGACRDIFDVTRGAVGRNPWLAKRCPGNVDPDPADTSNNACLTDGQITTMNFFLKPYQFATPLANGSTAFGNYVPGPGTRSLLDNTRYAGQEGGGATVYSGGQGAVFVLGTLFKDLTANPLTTYLEGGIYNNRRVEMSQWLDSTDPNLNTFYKRGGKLLVLIATDDNTAAPGAQLNYYQSVLDKMGRPTVDAFARLYVLTQAGHSGSANNSTIDGDGNTIPAESIPLGLDRLFMITEWTEKNVAPGKAVIGNSATRNRPVCSYPEYPKYVSGDVRASASYICTTN